VSHDSETTTLPPTTHATYPKMDSNWPQTPSSSASRKLPPPIKILGPDHESVPTQTTQGKSTGNSAPSTPLTPRHRRSRAQVDPAAALDAWNSSPRSRDFAKSPNKTLANWKSLKQFEPASSYDVSARREVLEFYIQAAPEHGVDVVDWAVGANTEASESRVCWYPTKSMMANCREEYKRQTCLKQTRLD
jgi:hypothetical protein